MKRPIAVYASDDRIATEIAREGFPAQIEKRLGIKLHHGTWEHHKGVPQETGALAQWLQEHYGITAKETERHGAALDAHGGFILVLSGDSPHPPGVANLPRLAVFPDPKSQSAPDDAAKPPRKQKSDAQISGMVATGALAFMFVFMGLLIWMS